MHGLLLLRYSNDFRFFFSDTPTTEIYTLSLHDALPILGGPGDADEWWSPNGSMRAIAGIVNEEGNVLGMMPHPERVDRKSTRLNSSHMSISYAVFCLKKKNNIQSDPYLHVHSHFRYSIP